MAEKTAGTPKYADIASTAAAIAAVIAVLQTRKVSAAPHGEVTLDEVTLQLLAAMAQNQVNILEAIQNISISGVDVLGVGVNADSMDAVRVVPAAINTPTRLPDIVVPHNMTLLVMAEPTNVGIIRVARSSPKSIQINSSVPLLATAFIGYRVKNANALWISSTWAGDGAVVTVEQMGGG